MSLGDETDSEGKARDDDSADCDDAQRLLGESSRQPVRRAKRSWFARNKWWLLLLGLVAVAALYVGVVAITHGAAMPFCTPLAHYICGHLTKSFLITTGAAAAHGGAGWSIANRSKIRSWFQKGWYRFQMWRFRKGWRSEPVNPFPSAPRPVSSAVKRRRFASDVADELDRRRSQRSRSNIGTTPRHSPQRARRSTSNIMTPRRTPVVARDLWGEFSAAASPGRLARDCPGSPPPAAGLRRSRVDSVDSDSGESKAESVDVSAAEGSLPPIPRRATERTSVRTPVRRPASRPWTPDGQRTTQEVSELSGMCLRLVKDVTTLLTQLQRSAVCYKPGWSRSSAEEKAARKAVYKQVQCNMIKKGLLPGMFPQSPTFGLQVPGSPPNDTRAAWQVYREALTYRKTRLAQLFACLSGGMPCFAVEGIDMRASQLGNKKALGKAIYYFMTTASMRDAALSTTEIHEGAHVIYVAGISHAVGSAPSVMAAV